MHASSHVLFGNADHQREFAVTGVPWRPTVSISRRVQACGDCFVDARQLFARHAPTLNPLGQFNLFLQRSTGDATDSFRYSPIVSSVSMFARSSRANSFSGSSISPLRSSSSSVGLQQRPQRKECRRLRAQKLPQAVRHPVRLLERSEVRLQS